MKQEFVTLPREVVEQALAAMESGVTGTDYDRKAQALRAALEAQVEQEPVATVNRFGTIYLTQAGCGMQPGTRLYTHPQPKREPLKNEQIDRIIADLAPAFLDTPTGFEEDFCRAIEAAHNIK